MNGLTCVCEADTKKQAIEDATNLFETAAYDDGEYGKGVKDVVLEIMLENGNVTEESIMLEWNVETETYDDGRADYAGSRL